MKIPKTAQESFDFLTRTPLNTIGRSVNPARFDPGGVSALEAWFRLDTHGEAVPCREPELLARAVSGKASWNLQVSQWAEDLVGSPSGGWAGVPLLSTPELLAYTEGLPKWIRKATMAQAASLARKRLGLVPGYLR